VEDVMDDGVKGCWRREAEERELMGGWDFTGARDGVLNDPSFLLGFCVDLMVFFGTCDLFRVELEVECFVEWVLLTEGVAFTEDM
jgi:hypothetical protein